MVSLGVTLINSDPEAARRWWERAAIAGNTNAMFNLGMLLQDSEPDAARRWWEAAAHAGNTNAMVDLGLLVKDSDPDAARRWWDRAAAEGSSLALFNLGKLLASEGDMTGGEKALQAAINSRDERVAPLASLYFRMLAEQKWDPDNAKAAVEHAASRSSDPEVAELASKLLTDLR
jgi:hypothetical protein